MSGIKDLIKSNPALFTFLRNTYLGYRNTRAKVLVWKRKTRSAIIAPFASALGLIQARQVKLFGPASAGNYRQISKLTVQSINQTFPFLAALSQSLHGTVKIYSVDEFCAELGERDVNRIQILKEKFEKYGSDKTSVHDYYQIYGHVLIKMGKLDAMLEVGMGTNNTSVASNMGSTGNPGASLRAFRDFMPDTKVFGADVDRGILFEEERIQSFFVDQTQASTFEDLEKSINTPLDFIIDDGLHSPNANLNTLNFALSHFGERRNAWFFIEDIREEAVPVWEVVSNMIPRSKYKTFLIRSKAAHVFAVNSI